jgi:membrane protein implicated in regulation of membrane protease activity
MPAIVFMAGFAAFWWIAGLWGSPLPTWFLVGGPIISVLLIFIARRRLRGAPARSPEEAKRPGRIVGWAAGGEGIAIAVVANLLILNGQRALVLPAIAIIVGLHFLPLALLLKVRIYYATALLIIVAGVAGLVLDAPLRNLVTGLTTAGLLWLTCVYRLSTEAPKRVVEAVEA